MFLFDYFVRNLKYSIMKKEQGLYLDIDFFFFPFFPRFLVDFGSFRWFFFWWCLVGKNIREDVESLRPRSLDTRPDSLPSSNFSIKYMISLNFYFSLKLYCDPLWNFFHLFNPLTKSNLIISLKFFSCVWLIVVTSLTSGIIYKNK